MDRSCEPSVNHESRLCTAVSRDPALGRHRAEDPVIDLRVSRNSVSSARAMAALTIGVNTKERWEI